MFLQCGGCGYTKSFTFNCSTEELEEQCHVTISDGWRYVESWKGFICQKCIKEGLDPFYISFSGGKPKMRNKVNSYKELMIRVIEQKLAFNIIKEML